MAGRTGRSKTSSMLRQTYWVQRQLRVASSTRTCPAIDRLPEVAARVSNPRAHRQKHVVVSIAVPGTESGRRACAFRTTWVEGRTRVGGPDAGRGCGVTAVSKALGAYAGKPNPREREQRSP